MVTFLIALGSTVLRETCVHTLPKDEWITLCSSVLRHPALYVFNSPPLSLICWLLEPSLQSLSEDIFTFYNRYKATSETSSKFYHQVYKYLCTCFHPLTVLLMELLFYFLSRDNYSTTNYVLFLNVFKLYAFMVYPIRVKLYQKSEKSPPSLPLILPASAPHAPLCFFMTNFLKKVFATSAPSKHSSICCK